MYQYFAIDLKIFEVTLEGEWVEGEVLYAKF